MDILPAAAALAVILMAAGLIVRSVPTDHPPRSRRVAHAPATAEDPTADPQPASNDDPTPAAADPWVVTEEPLIVTPGDLVAAGGKRGPVLAYVEQPRRSPDPERLIQTEVLIPTGTFANVWRAVRLAVMVIVFGVAFGTAIVAAARVIVWVFSAG